MKKAFALYFSLTLVFILCTSQATFAQFSFEIPSRTLENLRAFSLEPISDQAPTQACVDLEDSKIDLRLSAGITSNLDKPNKSTLKELNSFGGTYSQVVNSEKKRVLNTFISKVTDSPCGHPYFRRDLQCN